MGSEIPGAVLSRLCPLGVFLIGTLNSACVAPDAQADPVRSVSIALVGATVWDGTGQTHLDATVVTTDGRIMCVGASSDCVVPSDAEQLDVSGKWVIPGLIDAHVHFSQTGWVDGRPDALDLRDQYPYEETSAWLHGNTREIYRSYLCSGVTSVYDVGGYPWTWDLQSPTEDNPDAPTVRAAGPLLSTFDFWLNLPEQRQFILTADEHAVRQAVRSHVAFGTHAIKVWYIVRPGMDREHLSAMVHIAGQEARRLGVPLIVHATGLWQANDALRAGAQLLVHSVETEPVDDQFIELALANGTFYNPTLIVGDGYQQVRLRRLDRAAQSHECVDPVTLEKVLSTEGIPLDGPVDADAMRAARDGRLALMQANLQRVHAAGIPVVVGTDAGNPLTLHGASYYAEMEAMEAAGLTAEEVLVAATVNGARLMGLDRTGTLEPGSVADLLILGADPLASTSNVRDIEMVMRFGKLQPKSDLVWR